MYSKARHTGHTEGLYDHRNPPEGDHASTGATYRAISQGPEPPAKGKLTTDSLWPVTMPLDDWWVLDIVALVLSAILLMSMFVLLWYHDGKPQPDWQFVSLNTIVSWLSTLSKSMLLVPVARSLGQLKWIWYAREPRALSDLQAFDAASRGVAGSLQLLFSKTGRHLQSIGCVATILAIGFGPFLQSLVHYYPKVVEDVSQQAYITKGSHYSNVGLPSHMGTFDVDQVLKANVYSALFNNEQDRPWEKPRHVCNTGSCTFDPVVTLAARARCTDITKHVNHTCGEVCRQTEPPSPCGIECSVEVGKNEQNGTSLSYTPGIGGQGFVVNTTLHPFSGHLDMPVIHYLVIKDPRKLIAVRAADALTEDTEFIATECSIDLGVQGIQDSVVNSSHVTEEIGFWRYVDSPSDISTNETLLAWWQNKTAHLAMTPGSNHSTIPPNCLGLMCNRPLYTPPGFGFDHEALNALRNFFINLFDGFCSFMRLQGLSEQENIAYCMPSDDTGMINFASTDAAKAILFGEFSGCLEGHDHLTCGINNVAKALTKTFRDYAQTSTTDENATPDLHIGRTLVTLNYVRIDWMWMSMPILVWMMALLVSVGTAIATRRAKVPTWANNILPLLYLYRDHSHEKPLDNRGLLSRDYMQRARQIDVHLQVENNKAALAPIR